VIGAALSVILVRQGWQLDATPGDDVALSRESQAVFPFVAVRQVIDGEASGESWENLCNAFQGDIVLGTA